MSEAELNIWEKALTSFVHIYSLFRFRFSFYFHSTKY
jgi:hypothetical protein